MTIDEFVEIIAKPLGVSSDEISITLKNNLLVIEVEDVDEDIFDEDQDIGDDDDDDETK